MFEKSKEMISSKNRKKRYIKPLDFWYYYGCGITGGMIGNIVQHYERNEIFLGILISIGLPVLFGLIGAKYFYRKKM